jgi:hypothetical protein
MNIFVLDTNPVLAAQYQCDKHVVKMTLESTQLLCGPIPYAEYKPTHWNHPVAKWTRTSKENYEWLLEHAGELSSEYTFRYGRRHKCDEIIKNCARRYNILRLPSIGLTNFVQAMPDEYKNTNGVEAYRAYYCGEKAYFAKWTRRKIPEWYNDNGQVKKYSYNS